MSAEDSVIRVKWENHLKQRGRTLVKLSGYFVEFVEKQTEICKGSICPLLFNIAYSDPNLGKKTFLATDENNPYAKLVSLQPKGSYSERLWQDTIICQDVSITKSGIESWDMKIYSVMKGEKFGMQEDRFERNQILTDPNAELKLTDDGVFLFRKNPFYHCFHAVLWKENPQIFPYAGELLGQRFSDTDDEKRLAERTILMFWKSGDTVHRIVLCAADKDAMQKIILDVCYWRNSKKKNH